MSVKHAVLGLVIERPGYGYELIQRLEQRIEGWRPSETAVYPALRSLRAEGMIRAREAPPTAASSPPTAASSGTRRPTSAATSSALGYARRPTSRRSATRSG